MNTNSSTQSKRTTRDEFLASIRRSLEHKQTQPPAAPPPEVQGSVGRLADASDDLPTMFEANAKDVGMTVHRTTAAELTKRIAALLTELQAKRVAVCVGTVPAALNLADGLRRKGFDIVAWRPPADVDSLFEADAGITDVHAALAETGTLVCCSDAGHARGLSLAPPIHIAVVRTSDIVPDMLDYWATKRNIPPAELPSSINFITGPSKTADIEGILITGVHGPGQVHILLVEEDA